MNGSARCEQANLGRICDAQCTVIGHRGSGLPPVVSHDCQSLGHGLSVVTYVVTSSGGPPHVSPMSPLPVYGPSENDGRGGSLGGEVHSPTILLAGWSKCWVLIAATSLSLYHLNLTIEIN